VDDGAPAKRKKSLDKGFKRNLFIIGGFLLVCIAGMTIYVMLGNSNKNDNMPKSMVDKGMANEKRPSGNLSPDEMNRLNRVNEKQAQAAVEQGKTFIPKDIPLTTKSSSGYIPDDVDVAKNAPPPNVGYSVNGNHAGGGAAMSQQDAERYQRMMQGMQAQLQKLVQANVAPVSSSASRYDKKSLEDGATQGAIAHVQAQQQSVAQAGVASDKKSLMPCG